MIQNTGRLPRRAEPSEDELREMLESREQEKEQQRRKLSKKGTGVIVVFLLILGGVVMCFIGEPERPHTATAPADTSLEAAKAAIINQIARKNSDVPEELKPFTIKPESSSSHTEDVRFASELLQFLQPPATSPHKKSPAPKED